tara:strand:+ start:7256 stop:7390 length:135 start_codon:yes stop_codon:yes gene_type:complete
MYAISEEEFFMGATIVLIIAIPLVVRIYRYFNTKRVKKNFKNNL